MFTVSEAEHKTVTWVVEGDRAGVKQGRSEDFFRRHETLPVECSCWKDLDCFVMPVIVLHGFCI